MALTDTLPYSNIYIIEYKIEVMLPKKSIFHQNFDKRAISALSRSDMTNLVYFPHVYITSKTSQGDRKYTVYEKLTIQSARFRFSVKMVKK